MSHLINPILRRFRPQQAALEDMQHSVDRAWYAKTYPDVAATGLDPTDHFIRRGAFEGRRPNRFFDPDWYLRRYADSAGQLPILHYAMQGRRKRYDPGPTFSSSAYLDAHRDVASSGFDPLDHYVRHGQHEARAVKPADTKIRGEALFSRRLPTFPRLSEDELPGREQLARVQETFSRRQAGGGYLGIADQVASSQAPPPPSPAETRGSPFWFYNCSLNAEGTILRYARQDLVASPQYLTNFLGVKLASRCVGGGLIDGREGQIEAPPLPSNWHADLTEWAAVLRAVDLAGSSFTMIELGCVWACWMSNAGTAARQKGRTSHLVGIQGEDPITFAEEVLETNGFTKADYRLQRSRRGARASDMVDLCGNERIDLLHVNLRGREAEFILDKLAELGANVTYLVISTYSRETEGELFRTLGSAGWRLEIERPAYLDLEQRHAPTVKISGAQGWRNMMLLPPRCRQTRRGRR